MSDYETDDRLACIEAIYDDEGTVFPTDFAWLISEVRRLRVRDQTCRAQRRMIDNQAATIERVQRLVDDQERDIGDLPAPRVVSIGALRHVLSGEL